MKYVSVNKKETGTGSLEMLALIKKKKKRAISGAVSL